MCVFAVGLCCITAKGLNKSETKLELLLNSRSQNICIKDNAATKRVLHYQVRQFGFANCD